MADIRTRHPVKGKDSIVSNEETDSGHATNSDDDDLEEDVSITADETPYKDEIVWGNIVKFIILHTAALYGLSIVPFLSWKSLVWLLATYWFSGAGITAGAHRLWAHRAYKAKAPLRLFLTLANSMAGQNSIYVWCRDHRVHHKCSETVGDPHNAKRGFFFAHMGWLLVRKHPAVLKAGKRIDMSDLEADPVVMFQHRHYLACYLAAAFLLPTLVPWLGWGESLSNAYFMAVFRYVAVLHFTWLVNSAAHFFGNKPYDVNIGATENMAVSVLAMGEGFHNYHHAFPWDYSTSEWGLNTNLTTGFIRLMAFLGQAYRLRSTTAATIAARAARTGQPLLTKQGGQGNS